MTPKDKAKELVIKYIQYTPVEFEFEYAKKCALIAVDEILGHMGADRGYAFWTEVKQELEKL
jgi:hypothetical protein